MDWAGVIERNRALLAPVIAALFVLAGISEGGAAVTLPRRVYRAVLRILRPAESAVRRLIVIAARGLAVKPCGAKAFPAALLAKAGAARAPGFALIDPLKRFAKPGFVWGAARSVPRICVPGLTEPDFIAVRKAPAADDPLSAARLCQRLNALKRALDDLPKQARRLARWQARHSVERLRSQPFKPRRLWPLRSGPAPGRRKRHVHAIDELLDECHSMALCACEKPRPPNHRQTWRPKMATLK